MSVETFENNESNISENIGKLKLKQNIKSQLSQRKQIFDNFIISLSDNTEN